MCRYFLKTLNYHKLYIDPQLYQIKLKGHGPIFVGILTANPFDGPNIEAKLAADPSTRQFMSDPGFLKILSDIKSNPEALKM